MVILTKPKLVVTSELGLSIAYGSAAEGGRAPPRIARSHRSGARMLLTGAFS